MAKADRVVSYFPSFYRATERTKVLYDVVAALAVPIEEADTLLFRIQRAHRLKVAEDPRDILRLAATLNLTPLHFDDLLSDHTLKDDDRLQRMRERVWRVAQLHLTGLGTPGAVMEATAIFLDAAIVPERSGDPPIKHLDDESFSHVAMVEFSHLPDTPRERIYLHENPLLRRKEEPTGRWPLGWWTITNNNVGPSPVTLSIQGVEERTVLPSIFCPDTGEGILFNGVIPAGRMLLIDEENGARLDGVSVDEWLISYQGGIYDFAAADGGMALASNGNDSPPFDGDLTGIASEYQPKPLPRARVGQSRWYFKAAEGVFDGTLFDYSAYQVLPAPIGAYDGDFAFDACLFDYPPSAIAGMAWDERQLCAFKLLLPAYIPPPSPPPNTPPDAASATPGNGKDPATSGAPGQGVNYVGRIGTILPRFQPAGIRAYVDLAPDAWILGQSVLRSQAATGGEGITFHTTRVRNPHSDMFVDPRVTG